MGKLDGKVAIVTGGGSGIGKGIAKAFIEEGCAVVIAARNADRLNDAVKELEQDAAAGGSVVAIPTDVTNEDQMVNLFAKAEAAPDGQVRGARHTMLGDSDLHSTRHARAAVGAVRARLTAPSIASGSPWEIPTNALVTSVYGVAAATPASASSCILMAGAISNGSMAPSITPLASICGICGRGAPIGTAPSDFRYQPPARVAVRILRPFYLEDLHGVADRRQRVA